MASITRRIRRQAQRRIIGLARKNMTERELRGLSSAKLRVYFATCWPYMRGPLQRLADRQVMQNIHPRHKRPTLPKESR